MPLGLAPTRAGLIYGDTKPHMPGIPFVKHLT